MCKDEIRYFVLQIILQDPSIFLNMSVLMHSSCFGNRKGRNSGGVAVYMKNDLAADMVTVASYSNGVIEFIGLYPKQII